MIAFPILAAVVSVVFGVHLLVRTARSGNWFEGAWSVSMLMYAAASGALALGVGDGWSSSEFRTYWMFGAVLTVPYLALGEAYLLAPHRWVGHAVFAGVLVATALAAGEIRTAPVNPVALAEEFPLGREVFGDGTAAHRLAQYFSYSAYAFLIIGVVLSARRMYGRPELRNRFNGVLLVALGATVAAVGSGIGAGLGNFAVFSVGIAAGAAVLYWGFLLASRPSPVSPTAPSR